MQRKNKKENIEALVYFSMIPCKKKFATQHLVPQTGSFPANATWALAHINIAQAGGTKGKKARPEDTTGTRLVWSYCDTKACMFDTQVWSVVQVQRHVSSHDIPQIR